MIPDEAVEAAAIALAQCGSDMWERQDRRFKSRWRSDARIALEAAAPHLMATALRGAADDLTGARLLPKPFHEYYPEWLRKRAVELESIK